MADVVADNKVVLFNYTLTDAEGEEIDSSEGDPLPYLHGASNIVPGLEREMTGKKVGDAFQVVVPPTQGYGDLSDEPEQEVPRNVFPPDVEEGMPFVLEGEDGSLLTIWITEVTDETVRFGTDHPLAGVELHFDIQITEIRDATEEEIEHGHPHGPGGAHDH